MNQFEKLDYLIVEAIKSGASKFEAINSNTVKDEAGRLYLEDRKVRGPSAKPLFRIIDSRLQALRKRGVIEHSRGCGWRAKEAA